MQKRLTRLNWELIGIIILSVLFWGMVFGGGMYLGWKMKEREGTVTWKYEDCK